MKNINLIFVAIGFYTIATFAQVTPNSIRFDVENYIAIDNSSRYYPYTSHGFYENSTGTTKPRIFILPNFKLELNKIKYLDNQGRETYQDDQNIRSMIIPVTQDLSLPNESQKAAIIATISKNTTIQAFYPQIAKNNLGFPLMNSNLLPVISNQLIAMANQYEASLIIPQQQLINEYNTRYNAEIISLTELEVIVEVGSEIVYSKRMPNTWITTGGTLKNIVIDNPTEYIKNVIAGGNGQILVSYKFRDSKKSSISANINATAIIDQFLSEAYQSSVSQRSSGWSFLGLGSSKKSIKSSFDQQVNQQYSSNSIANTTIEMYDADDQMIKQFESTFFPSLTQQEAIQNHANAAEKAKADGNLALQELHLKYIEELKSNNPNLTPNIDAALAALGKNDYVGFLAHGVRWGNQSGSGNNSFRRVLNSSEMASMTQNWNQTKIISLQHTVTQPVLVSEEVKFKASLGAIDGISFQNNLYMTNGYSGSWQNVNGVIIGPITLGGVLHQNNILAGSLMTKIGPHNVYSPQTLNDAISRYSPGDRVYLTMIVQVGSTNIYPAGVVPVYQEQRTQVTLGAYPKTE
ncbi:hypothetical protein FLCU109888_11860 [Flavobacterium cucumis]|uniref:Uncharacterized protein n=1 Tax=Flavobacterium cucumis TaxID=416016 RepID=A0A1M7ZWK5_9FLAO|nr:hypothetical protein [Flavobacterium cucumis]SHO73271.1 hypothetical protein SAMN05443547_1627 [Flavobacterium cucumis]